jgi:hypothetical protein
MQKGEWIPQIGSLVQLKSNDELYRKFGSVSYEKFAPHEIELTENGEIKHFISMGNGYRGEVSIYSHDYKSLIETPAEVVRGRWCGGRKYFPVLVENDKYHENLTLHFGRGSNLMIIFHWASGKHLLIPRYMVKPFENSTQEAMQTCNP